MWESLNMGRENEYSLQGEQSPSTPLINARAPLISRGIFRNTDYVAIGLEVSVRSPRSKNDPNQSHNNNSSICFMWHAYVSELP